jgi:hypothetical protein
MDEIGDQDWADRTEISDISNEDFEEEELKAFIEECTDFIGPFELEDEQ